MSDRTICLDLDGTLITCEPRQSAVLRAALAASGTSADVAKVWELKREGATTEDALRALDLAPDLAADVARRWRDMVEQPFWLELDSAFPEALSTLPLMKANFELALITARSRPEWAECQIRGMGLREFFSRVEIVSPSGQHVAKTAVFKAIAPVAVFGDTETDSRAAAASNVEFYAVASGQRSSTFLRSERAVTVSENLAEAWRAFAGKHR